MPLSAEPLSAVEYTKLREYIRIWSADDEYLNVLRTIEFVDLLLRAYSVQAADLQTLRSEARQRFPSE